MKISAAMVKDLREATGAGVLDAKKTLEATNGDFDKAMEILQAKGAVRAAERSHREASEGVIEVYAHPGNRVGVMVEVNCETDFVAKTTQFQELAHDLALHVAALNPRYVASEDIPQEDLHRITEEYRIQARAEGKPDAIVEKIVAGRLSKYYEETCLLEQPFVKDDSVRVKDLILDTIRSTDENIIVRRFARFELGAAE